MLAMAVVGACLAEVNRPGAAAEVPDSVGRSTGSPRDEVRPAFDREPVGWVGRQVMLIIRAGRRDGVDSYWTKSFPVARAIITGSTRATGQRAWSSPGGASWPRSTGGTPRAGTSRSTSRR
jgi:hypothetical protein